MNEDQEHRIDTIIIAFILTLFAAGACLGWVTANSTIENRLRKAEAAKAEYSAGFYKAYLKFLETEYRGWK